MDESRSKTRRLLVLLGIATVIFAGILFRATHVNHKVYWYDEVYTFLWLAGVDLSEGPLEVCDGREVSIADLHEYQRVQPERGFFATIQTLAANDAQHPPGYYAFAWIAGRCCTNTKLAARGVAVLFGLLTLPAMYWLCLEAFSRRRAAWLGTLMTAVSPIHVLFSQEAREYSMWTFAIVLATACLLRAVRLGTRRAWALYACAGALGMYAHGLYLLVLFTHGAWVALLVVASQRRGQAKRLTRAFGLAALGTFVLFAPWGVVMISKHEYMGGTTAWMRQSDPSANYARNWLIYFAYVFVDGDYEGSELWGAGITILRALAVSLGVGTLLFTWRDGPRKTWLLAVLLIAIPMGALAGPDLLFGGQRSLIARYFFPCYIGVSLATVHFLMPYLESRKWVLRLGGQLLAAALLIVGGVSCATIWNAEAWWNKGGPWPEQLPALHVVNANPQALVLCPPFGDDGLGYTMAFSHSLDPRVRIRVMPDGTDLEVPPGSSNVYFLNLSDEFARQLSAGRRLEQLAPKIWRCID